MLLVNYEHLAVANPYRSRYAIYVREDANEARPAVDEIPQALGIRLLSLRGFSAAGELLEADVAAGDALRVVIERMFANPAVAYLHAHNAKPGLLCGAHRACLSRSKCRRSEAGAFSANSLRRSCGAGLYAPAGVQRRPA